MYLYFFTNTNQPPHVVVIFNWGPLVGTPHVISRDHDIGDHHDGQMDGQMDGLLSASAAQSSLNLVCGLVRLGPVI